MAVSYAPTKLRVPPGFQNLLEGLAREVLREQPDDILSFAAQYFKTQLAVREETGKDDAKKGSDMEKLMQGEAIDIDINDPGINEAATKIQASFRGYQARQEIQQKKEQEKAATKIQASFRGHQTRKELNRNEENIEEKESLGTDETAEKPVETNEEIEDINLEDPEVQKAAITIQSSFRGHKAREEVKELKSKTDSVSDEQPAETENEGENKTQKAEDEEEIDINLEDPDVQKAAVTIQASFRGHKAREDLKKVKSASELTEQEQVANEQAESAEDFTEEKPCEDAAAEPQQEIDIDLNDPEVNKAATMIQASFRGHKVRNEMKEKEEEKTEEIEEEKGEKEEAS